MKVRAKCGLIYNGTVYKAGEVFEVEDGDGYAFPWLKNNSLVEPVDAPADETADDLLADEKEIPPIEELPPVKKGKKNV